MLSHAVPAVQDAMLPEQLVEGDSDILQMGLPSIVLCLLHCLACGHHSTPGLHNHLLCDKTHLKRADLDSSTYMHGWDMR